jgi:hypothetical protein
MGSKTLKQAGMAVIVSLLTATSFATPSHAWIRVGGCFACGGRAFAAGAVAGAALARPYYPRVMSTLRLSMVLPILTIHPMRPAPWLLLCPTTAAEHHQARRIL